MTETFLLNRSCPNCLELIDCQDAPFHPGSAPAVDDFSVCIHCGEVLQFNADLTVRRSSVEEAMAHMDAGGVREVLFLRAVIKHALPKRSEKRSH